MNLLKISRKYHRWLMLFLGVQFVIWSVSGAYMVIFDIDYIHGDTLVVNHQAKVNPDKITYSLFELIKRYPSAEQIEVGLFINQEVYRFRQDGTQYLLDASTGHLLSPIGEELAVTAARHYYSGTGDIADVELITDNPPFELSSRALPAWRVNFDDFGSPSIYLSARSGKLVTKRHEFWRTFDTMFSLHVMDYEDEDASNWLLFWFILFSLLAAILGLVLTYFRFFKANAQDNDDGNESVSENKETSHVSD
ncbi:PepSY domain-containing protein [Shewanella canadensis]|uniref:PepSY domain-containing protein n=1 Tax=Shewanella canadensis TaxID=271096 RepID=A0A3S0LM99_9GAMM|nr:PepSY domain-containing protein [Shewanella canadensis]RTR38785.1 PepSY domain-containing protein [Shewanella canadensis]